MDSYRLVKIWRWPGSITPLLCRTIGRILGIHTELSEVVTSKFFDIFDRLGIDCLTFEDEERHAWVITDDFIQVGIKTQEVFHYGLALKRITRRDYSLLAYVGEVAPHCLRTGDSV